MRLLAPARSGRIASELLVDVVRGAAAPVASRPDPHVAILVFRPRGLGVDQPAAPAGLRIVLEALGAASIPPR